MSHHIIFLIDFRLITEDSSKTYSWEFCDSKGVAIESMNYLITQHQGAVEIFNKLVKISLSQQKITKEKDTI